MTIIGIAVYASSRSSGHDWTSMIGRQAGLDNKTRHGQDKTSTVKTDRAWAWQKFRTEQNRRRTSHLNSRAKLFAGRKHSADQQAGVAQPVASASAVAVQFTSIPDNININNPDPTTEQNTTNHQLSASGVLRNSSRRRATRAKVGQIHQPER